MRLAMRSGSRRRGERDHREVGHEHEGEAFRAARQEFDATRRSSPRDGTVHGVLSKFLPPSMSQIRYYDVNGRAALTGHELLHPRAKSKK